MTLTIGGKSETRLDVVAREFRIVEEYRVFRHARCEPAKDVVHRNAHAPNRRLSAPLSRFQRDIIPVIHGTKYSIGDRLRYRLIVDRRQLRRVVHKINSAAPPRRRRIGLLGRLFKLLSNFQQDQDRSAVANTRQVGSGPSRKSSILPCSAINRYRIASVDVFADCSQITLGGAP